MARRRKLIISLLLNSIFISNLNVISTLPAPLPSEATSLQRIDSNSIQAPEPTKLKGKERSLVPLTKALEEGQHTTAGEAFKLAMRGGAETPFSPGGEALDLIATSFGRGRISEKKGPIDYLFYAVPEVIGSIGSAVIDTVSNATGTQSLVRPIVALAGAGLGFGMEQLSPLYPPRAVIKGGYDVIKTIAIVTGLDGVLGLKELEKKIVKINKDDKDQDQDQDNEKDKDKDTDNQDAAAEE